MEGPLSAPSSPPDTPVPMKRKPLSSSSLLRRTVSGKYALPPSMMISPWSRYGRSCSIVASVALPACTMIRILRGTSGDCTNSSTEKVPTKFLPSASAIRSLVFSGERLYTDTEKPLLSMLRAKFLPITAKPITPICCFAIWFSTLCTLYFCEIHFSQYQNTTLCQIQQSSACEREINFIDKAVQYQEIAHFDYFNVFAARSEPLSTS
ncbi:hypothetical protein D3C80_1352280 [compost metagenome]